MKKRWYNVLFDIHTVAGIFISCILFVMFFTGTLSFIRDETIAWERNEPVRTPFFSDVDFDKLIDTIQHYENLDYRSLSFSQYYNEQNLGTNLSKRLDGSESSLGGRRGYFTMNIQNGNISSYNEQMSIGEIFYRLHFLAQLNIKSRSGYMIAGFVSFFFLVVLFTGLYIHWDKMISHFHLFRAHSKWNILWKDSHVSIGFISLPFQLIYAISGCTILLSSFIFVEPAINYLYKEGEEGYYEKLETGSTISLETTNEQLTKSYSINSYIQKAKDIFPNIEWSDLEINNINDKNMTVALLGFLPYEKDIASQALIKFKVENDTIIEKINPSKEDDYTNLLEALVYRLHFGDFGGYPLKIIYTALGLLSSYVIMSGVLLWHSARDKKNVSPQKRRINFYLTKFYLSISLSIIPIVPIALIISKYLQFTHGYPGKNLLFNIFFYGWAVLAFVMMFLKSFRQINLLTLFLTAFFGLLIPIIGGLTNQWFWHSLNPTYIQLFVVDVFWLIIGLIALLIIFQTYKYKTRLKNE